MILNSSVGSVTDILNTRNIITDVREKVPNLKRFGRHSSIAQSVVLLYIYTPQKIGIEIGKCAPKWCKK